MTINIDELIEEIKQGIKDARADFPDVPEDDITREIANSILAYVPDDIAQEIRSRLV